MTINPNTVLLKQILAELKTLNAKIQPQKPELPFTFLLSEFKDFDYSRIEAEVVQKDQYGVSVIRWQNQLYARRSPKNKYKQAVWFSRKAGDDYEKLIRFVEPSKIEPLNLP